MWRKTRVPYYNCVGADPNRNWAYQWGANGGSSTNPCSESYAGPAAFSEPTTRSFSEYIATVGHKLLAYIGFHSYSQYLLIPYGHTDEKLDNYDDLVMLFLLKKGSTIPVLLLLFIVCCWNKSNGKTARALWYRI